MTKPRFRGIIFDKDGTLFDFQKTWTPWMANLLKILCSGNKELSRQKGYSLGFDFDKRIFLPESSFIAGTPEQFLHQLQTYFPEWPEKDLLNVLTETTNTTEQIEVVPLAPVLSNLRNEGYVLGLATNDDVQEARKHLEEKEVLKYFDFLAGYNSGFKAKPDPAMLLAFCQKTKLFPGETIMVGDSISDLTAGKKAGMFTVAVLSGVSKSKVLAKHANLVIKDIGDLQGGLVHANLEQ